MLAGKLPVSAAMIGVEQQSSAGAMPAQRPLPAGGVPAADMPSMAPSAPYRPSVCPKSTPACYVCLLTVPELCVCILLSCIETHIPERGSKSIGCCR